MPNDRATDSRANNLSIAKLEIETTPTVQKPVPNEDRPWKVPATWTWVYLEDILAPLDDGRTLHHGWSPQCEAQPSQSADHWGVLKTTAIQPGSFQEKYNKRLPSHLPPRPTLEVQSGDLLITCAGPRSRCGIVCLVRTTRPRLLLSGKMYRFRPKPELMDAEFLESYFQTLAAQQAVDKIKTGGSDSGLNLTHDRFRKLIVPLPPLLEQRRIIARINELSAEIVNGEAGLRSARDGLAIFHRALLKAAMTGELTCDWRSVNRSNENGSDFISQVKIEKAQAANGRRKAKFSSSSDEQYSQDLVGLPESWASASLGELFNLFTGATPSRSVPEYWNGEVPWVSSGEVAFCRIDSTKENITLAGLASSSTRIHPVGTVLLAMIGEGKTRGQCAVLGVEAANNQNSAAIRVSETSIIPEFVYEFLSYRYEKTRNDGQGGNQPALNLGKVARIQMPVPPLSEMQRIMEIVGESRAAMDDIVILQSRAASDAAMLRQSILKAAFEGRLVAQNPADEPSVAVLTRISAHDPGRSRTRRRAA